jgi:hypothetical protein
VTISIVPTTKDHVAYILETLREADKWEIEAAGGNPEYALYRTLECSLWSNTALLDETPVAFWGIAGVALGDVGVPFLLTSKDVLKVPAITFARVYKNQIQRMRKSFPHLENCVDANYTGAVKMLKIAGFSLGEPFEAGKGVYRKFYLDTDI